MSRKGFAPLIIIGIVAVVVVALLIGPRIYLHFYPSTFDDSKDMAIGQIVSSSIPTTIQGSTTIQTSPWQVYTNTNYGFHLKFPFAWKNIVVKNETNAEHQAIVDFYLTTTDKSWISQLGTSSVSMFYIQRFTPSDWKTYQANGDPGP